MILQNDPIKPIQQLSRLPLLQLVDPLGKPPQRENALPPRHRIRPYHRVHRREVPAHVQRAAPRLLVNGDAFGVVGHGAVEPVADEGGREPFKEALVGPREAVVDLVARGPEGVAAAVGGQLGQAQGGVVGGAGLELDVAVPGGRVVPTFVSRRRGPECLAI